MKFNYLLVSLILALVISGCTIYGGQTTPNQTTPNYTQPPQTPPQQPPPPAPPGPLLVSFISLPTTANVGDMISFSWDVNGTPATIPRTGVRYDYASHPGTLGTGITPDASGYAYDTPGFGGSVDIPNTFAANANATQAGTVYYRAYATAADGKNYWTDEFSIVVSAPAQPSLPPQSYYYTADDSGFYANDTPVYSLSVSKGTPLTLQFKVSTTNVYHGGLDFRGCGQENTTTPGQTATLQIAPNGTCTITSYWPATGNVKSSLQILVQ